MTIEEVKQTVFMNDILQRYGICKQRSMVSCPKHKDKTPSMKIYKDGFRCFSCGWSGDIFDFVRFMDNLTFKEAFIALGGTYGDTDREEVKRKIRLAEIERQKKAEREAEMRRKRDKNNRYITALRNGLMSFPVFSDEWCFCQDELPKQLYLHEILSEGGDQVGAT